MTAKHTPGPWTFSKHIDGLCNVTFDICQEDGAPYTSSLSDVAYCSVFHTYVDEYINIQEANARLMAAAPELLAAAKLIVDYYDQSYSPVTSALENAVNAAKQAIAQATGETK